MSWDDQPDVDAWVDRDGTVWRGDGPYQHRWTRRLRRWVSDLLRRAGGR